MSPADMSLAALWGAVETTLADLRSPALAAARVPRAEAYMRMLAGRLATAGGGANCPRLAEEWLERARTRRAPAEMHRPTAAEGETL